MSEGKKSSEVTVHFDNTGRVIINSGETTIMLLSHDPYTETPRLRRLIGELMASEYERGKVDGAAEKPPTVHKSLIYVARGDVGFGFATKHTAATMTDAAKRVDWRLLPSMTAVVGEMMPPKPEHENSDPDSLVAEAIMHMLRNP